MNSQNDLLYAPVATKNDDISAIVVFSTRVQLSGSLLRYQNLVMPTSFSLNQWLKSTFITIEMCCRWLRENLFAKYSVHWPWPPFTCKYFIWSRRCRQRYTELLEMRSSSSSTSCSRHSRASAHHHSWHVVGQQSGINSVDYHIWGVMQWRVYQVSGCGRVAAATCWLNASTAMVDDATDQWR